MSKPKINIDDIIGTLGKQQSQTESTRLGKEFPGLKKVFDGGKFPVPDFKPVKPYSPKPVTQPVRDSSDVRWKFAGRDSITGRKIFVPQEQTGTRDTFAPKGDRRVGRFTEPATVRRIEVQEQPSRSSEYVQLTFNVSYGFGSTTEEMFDDHRAMMSDALTIWNRWKPMKDMKMLRTPHAHGLYVHVFVPFDDVEALRQAGYIGSGLFVSVDDQLIELIMNKQI